jgi:hypothetical protein
MMDDNQIAELFVDIYDNHWGADTKFNDYVLPEKSELTAYIKVCCAIGLRAYANREVDVAKFTQSLIDAIDEVVPNISAQDFLNETWIDLCNAHGKNPDQEFSSFSDFVAWDRPQIESIGQLIECTTGLDLGTCFGAAKYADYSPGVIEEVAERFYADFVNTESQLIRFAFYGALYSMQPSDPRVSKLNAKFKAEEEDAFLRFILDEIDAKGTRNNILQEAEIEVLQSPVPRVISSMNELTGVALADLDPHAPSYEDIEENGVNRILSEDFKELEKLAVVDFLDYIAFTWDLVYPKALYLAVANPFITFDFEIPKHTTVTYDAEWEFYVRYSDDICSSLPGDFYDIFLTVPRVRTFYSLQYIWERTEGECGNISWDPYASILFTRSDLAGEQRATYIIDQLTNHSEQTSLIDGSEVMDSQGFIDVEISCLFETDGKLHQLIFEANSESLNLALLLNPSISNELRSQIEASGVSLEFPENFDAALSELIEQADTYKDPGLAEILRDLDLDDY